MNRINIKIKKTQKDSQNEKRSYIKIQHFCLVFIAKLWTEFVNRISKFIFMWLFFKISVNQCYATNFFFLRVCYVIWFIYLKISVSNVTRLIFFFFLKLSVSNVTRQIFFLKISVNNVTWQFFFLKISVSNVTRLIFFSKNQC